MSYVLSKIQIIVIICLLGMVQSSYAENKQKLNLEQASESVRKASKGKILSAKTTHVNGVATHRIQVLTESGRVKIFQVPAFDKNTKTNNSNQYRDNNKPSTNNYYSNDKTKKSSTNRSRYNKPVPSRRSNTSSKPSSVRSKNSVRSNGGTQKK